MLGKILAKDDDIIYLHQAHAPPYSRQNNIMPVLKCGWGIAELKQHLLESIRAHVTGKSRLISIAFRDRDSPVPPKGIEHR